VKKSGVEMNDILLEKATDLLTAIIVFLRGALLYLKHDYFFHVLKGVINGARAYAEAKSDLDGAINEYDQALLLQVTMKLITSKPPDPTPMKGPTTSELVLWLQSSYWEVEAEFSQNCRNRADGTFEWVFEIEEFKNWRLGESTDTRFLWLNGLPGVGKSTIAAYIVQILRAQHVQSSTLYFSCKSGDSNLDNLSQIIRTLAVPLIQDIPSARDHIMTLKEKGFKITTNDPVFLFQNLIRDALKEVTREIFIVIDGLDECDSDEFADQKFESLLKGLSAINVKLLISSRVTAEISSGLHHARKREMTYEDSRCDIELYVNHCVKGSRNLEKGFKALGINPSEFLSEKSKGNFLWVKLMLDALKKKTSLKEFQAIIDKLPKDLEGLYDQVLQRLEARDCLSRALTVFRCIVYSCRPMTIPELEVAVGLILDDEVFDIEAWVDDECGAILRKTPTTPTTFYIAHETFRSFITSPSPNAMEYRIDSRSSHLQIEKACLECLMDLEQPELQRLRNYAVANWLEHLHEIFSHIPRTTAEELLPLLSRIRDFIESDVAVQEWMKDYCSDTADAYRIASLMASFHNFLTGFVSSSSRVNGLDQDPGAEDIIVWMTSLLEGQEFRSRILSNFYHTWLRTNWKELDLAQWIVRAVVRLDHLLVSLSGPPGESPSQGWESWSVSQDNTRASADLIREMAVSADFQDHIGIQCGNFAIGLLEADSSECAKYFQDAIDDCPEQWHLYEGLASYYSGSGNDSRAIEALEKALAADTKKYPSSAFNLAKLRAEAKETEEDLEGAVQALKQGLERSSEADASKYWNAMAKIFESRGNGNRMIDIYKEAVKAHPKAGDTYWVKVAETYGRGGGREKEWSTYREAIKEDPENVRKYGEKIRKIADELTALCVWPPVPVVLGQGAIEDPENANLYYKQLGKSYMCQRKWKEALDQFQKYSLSSNDKWIYENIGDAYLGLGDTAQSLDAYKLVFSDSMVVGRARTMGYVYIIDGSYNKAIRTFEAALKSLKTDSAKGGGAGAAFGAVSDASQQREFRFHLQLGLCYEAIGNEEKMKENLENAIGILKPVAKEMDSDEDRELVYRHEARTLFHLGLVEEKLGETDAAKETLKRAVDLFEKTSLKEDDELQTSEAMEANDAMERLDAGSTAVPDLKESIGSMRLQRRLAIPHTTDWFCVQTWKEEQRMRGAKSWNEVSFTNKFQIREGDRSFIFPWGFGHY
jgi:tetratricopeptide (TPR) repeat protein